jgi:hypothetical protein
MKLRKIFLLLVSFLVFCFGNIAFNQNQWIIQDGWSIKVKTDKIFELREKGYFEISAAGSRNVYVLICPKKDCVFEGNYDPGFANKEFWEMVFLPRLDNNKVEITLRTEDKEEKYYFDLNFYRIIDNVVSEEKLDNEEEELIKNLYQEFGFYRSDMPMVYILRPGEIFPRNWAWYSKIYDVIVPKMSDWEKAFYHELSHVLYEEENFIQEIMLRIHRELTMLAGTDDPLILINSKIFKIFKEGEYIEDQPWAGHPWDNPDEFFASLMTTYRFFRGEFNENICNLDKIYRERIIEYLKKAELNLTCPAQQ